MSRSELRVKSLSMSFFAYPHFTSPIACLLDKGCAMMWIDFQVWGLREEKSSNMLSVQMPFIKAAWTHSDGHHLMPFNYYISFKPSQLVFFMTFNPIQILWIKITWILNSSVFHQLIIHGNMCPVQVYCSDLASVVLTMIRLLFWFLHDFKSKC